MDAGFSAMFMSHGMVRYILYLCAYIYIHTSASAYCVCVAHFHSARINASLRFYVVTGSIM